MIGRMLLPVLLMAPVAGVAQDSDLLWLEGLETYWAEIDQTFRDPDRSPLPEAYRGDFVALDRFAPDASYRVTARFKPARGKEFAMATTTERRPTYRKVGTLKFKLHGRSHQLTVFQSVDLTQQPAYKDQLFLPFTDMTNGESTYGGGRYLDLAGPLGREVGLDLNKAYAPYCAYGGNYSCPIPPPENHLTVPVLAGVKKFRADR